MIRRLFRFAIKLGLTAAVGAAVSKVLARRRTEPFAPPSSAPWPPMETPATPAALEEGPADSEVPDAMVAEEPLVVEELLVPDEPLVEEPLVAEELLIDEALVTEEPLTDESVAWVEPDDEGECPPSHPLKAKLSSGVFHLPGMANYERTKADRCYPNEATAEADELRQAKR